MVFYGLKFCAPYFSEYSQAMKTIEYEKYRLNIFIFNSNIYLEPKTQKKNQP